MIWPSKHKKIEISGTPGAAATSPLYSPIGAPNFGAFATTSVSVPAAINNPVVGTDLTGVWNLQYSGTGPRSAYTNGAWPPGIVAQPGTNTGIPSYLAALGFVWANNDGAIHVNAGSSALVISNYDFTLAPIITLDGSNSITFNDCKFQTSTSAFQGTNLAAPCDINGNIWAGPGGTLSIICNYCLFDQTRYYKGTGNWTNNYCKFSNQIQQLAGNSSGNHTFDHCYIPGIGCNPPASSHVEALQFAGGASDTLTVTNCMIDVHANGQASLGTTSPNYGWTAIWSTGTCSGTWVIQNNIMIGVTEVNANPSNPNRIPFSIQYADALASFTLSNNVFEMAVFGYTTNANSGATRPTVSGNRTFANVALVAGDFN